VTDAHRAAIREGASHYVALSRQYLARGFAQPHPQATSDRGVTCRSRGPMSVMEWASLVAVLGESPDWAAARSRGATPAAWRERPEADAWCALEVLAHLRDADVQVYLPRLDRALREPGSEAPDVDMRGWAAVRRYLEQDPAAVLAAWREARASLVARLAPLGPRDWSRMVFHSRRGPLPIDEMVRGWVDHDLSHRRQFAAALEARRP
jgi:hypothetical protein